jgi:hypothetical protein
VLTESGLETGGSNAITAVISEEIGEDLSAYPEIGVGAAVDALDFGQRQAHGAQQAQSSVFPGSGSHSREPIMGPGSLVNHRHGACASSSN